MAKRKAELEEVGVDRDDHSLSRINGHKLIRRLFIIGIGVYLVISKRIPALMLNWRTELNHGLFICFVLDLAGIFWSMFYLAVIVKWKHGSMVMKRWRSYAPGAVYMMTVSNLIGYGLSILLFKGHLGAWTIPLMTIVGMAWMNLLTFIS